MKFEQTILDINDKVAQQRYTETVTDEEGNETQKISSKDLTLGNAITDAALIQIDEANISEEDHLMRYGIYLKVRSGDTNFTEEETTLIKSCIVKRYVPLFAGQLLTLINE
jgi:hypothetical protein